MAEGTDTTAKAARKSGKGAYLVVTPTGEVIAEPSEIRALRTVAANGGKHIFVEWGKSITPTRSVATSFDTAGTVPVADSTEPENPMDPEAF